MQQQPQALGLGLALRFIRIHHSLQAHQVAMALSTERQGCLTSALPQVLLVAPRTLAAAVEAGCRFAGHQLAQIHVQARRATAVPAQAAEVVALLALK
jgi:hypothetical protein